MELDLTEASVAQLAKFYYSSEKKLLRANMVISQDGHFVDEHGSSRGLSSQLDLKVLLTLRALSDAVLVGGQTVRAENYQTPRLRGEYTQLNSVAPKLVVLSKSLNFHLASRLFQNLENPPIFLTEKNDSDLWQHNYSNLKSQSEIIVLPSLVNLKTVLDYLHSQALLQIVSEGGPAVLEQLISQDLVNELDITTSPVNLGKPAERSKTHEAIASWPNRVGAKLGSHRVFRIKR